MYVHINTHKHKAYGSQQRASISWISWSCNYSKLWGYWWASWKPNSSMHSTCWAISPVPKGLNVKNGKGTCFLRKNCFLKQIVCVFLFYMYACSVCMYVTQKRVLYSLKLVSNSWRLSCRCRKRTWILFWRTASVLNHWDISPGVRTNSYYTLILQQSVKQMFNENCKSKKQQRTF